MEWFKFYVRDLKSRLLLVTDDAAVGQWVRMLATCYDLENAGCFPNSKGFTSRQWLAITGVDRRAVDRVVAAGLAVWSEDGSLQIAGYDLELQKKATDRSRQNSELAQRRWAKGTTKGNAKGIAEGNAEGEGEREGEEEGEGEEDCAEASASVRALAPAEPALVLFPCAGNVETWGLTETVRAELAEAYPGVDVLACARKALEWCRANPKKIKTAHRMRAWLGSVWCGGDQDRGRSPSLQPNLRVGPVRAEQCHHTQVGDIAL